MLNSSLEAKGTGQRLPDSKRALPDPEICRAKHAGFGDYVDCQVPNPDRCIYALSFGGSYFCLHPERFEIVARTESDPG
jgi:hypothetical protein